uniref:SLAIN motif family, member 1a n=1 Tax=Gasterosteus aculeatus TaxID=69293 RepID=G3NAB9_GASAC
MEAEVLNPRAMADVNGNNSNKTSSAELEVLKLQELVRKLERQNEQLRTRANAAHARPVGPPHLQTSLSGLRGGNACASDHVPGQYGTPSPPGAPGATEEPFAYFQPSSACLGAAEEDTATVMDEVDVLDLDAALPIGQPDSWLYVSPKAKFMGECLLSPLQWCRQVLDHPGPEVELAKMTLCHRLDQDVGRRHAAISPQSSLDSEAGASELEDDSISMSYKLQDMMDVEVMARLQEQSLRQDYASTSNTATASRRRSSFSLHSLRRSEIYDQLPPPQPRLFGAGSMQRGGLPHSHTFSSIRDCRRGPIAPQFSLSGLSQYSAPLSLTMEAHTTYRSSTDKLRRSMPNLLRAPSMPSVPSTPCLASPVNPPSHGPSSLPTVSSLRSSQSFDSSSGLARLQSSIPSPGQLSQRVLSVGNFPTTPRHPLKATAYVSPTVQQGPPSMSASISLHSIPGSAAAPQPLKPSSGLVQQPPKAVCSQPAVTRSSLPRPASFVGMSGVPRASKISQPTRSLLTPPKSLAALTALRDGSWKDGCY